MAIAARKIRVTFVVTLNGSSLTTAAEARHAALEVLRANTKNWVELWDGTRIETKVERESGYWEEVSDSFEARKAGA